MNRRRLCQLTAAILISNLMTHMGRFPIMSAFDVAFVYSIVILIL